MILLVIWVAVLVAALVIHYRQTYSRFSRYGVKHFTALPFLGNMSKIMFQIEHFTDDIMKLYNKFPEER